VKLFDTVILNGSIVFPGRQVSEGNIGILNGKIAAITNKNVGIEGKTVINAQGKYIFPGIIETHSHLGIGAGEEDLVTETRAASLGGVTTVLFFLRQPMAYDSLYCYVRDLGEKKSYIDFSFHIVLMTDEHLNSVPRYIEDFGITSFKFYLTYRGSDAKMSGFGGHMMEFPGVNDGFMLDCFRELSNYPKSIVMVHAENIEIINRYKEKLISQGRSDLHVWALSRPVFAEVEGVHRAMFFAKEAGCRINILHITSQDALKEVIEFRKIYNKIFVEVCHPYLVLNNNHVTSKKFKLRPPLRNPEDNEALWYGIQNGDINTVGSDHVPRKLEAKMGDIWSPAAGAPGTPYLFPIMLSEGYHKRNIPLTKIAELLSLNPAQLYGLYPGKGDIRIDCDADLVIVDLDREYTIDMFDVVSYSDYILYDDFKLKGYPEVTIVRGKIIAQDGNVKGPSGWGKFIAR
jgi:dihydropyrimidinase